MVCIFYKKYSVPRKCPRKEWVNPECRKNNIARLLKGYDKKILVTIDDVDRLTPEEIRQVFRVVKAIADFPNIIYLIAFDKDIAIKALSEQNGLSGEEYLEKIVQLPLDLPPPDEASFRSMFFEKLNKIIGDTSEKEFDKAYWAEIYWKGLNRLISTPRDITRLTNTLSITYPLVKGEVNSIDFIALESIKVFCPIVYSLIQTDSRMFIGIIDKYGLRGPSLEDNKKFYEKILYKIDDKTKEPIKNLLDLMFPKLRKIYGKDTNNYVERFECRKQLRICSPDIFPIYFRLTIPTGSISTAEMSSILAVAADSKTFGLKLVELTTKKRPDGTTMAKAFIDRLGDHVDKKIPLEEIPPIVKVLFEMGDKLLLPEDEPQVALELSTDAKIRFLMRDLLSRLDKELRSEILKQALLEGHAVTIIVEFIRMLDNEHGRYDGNNSTLPEESRLVSEDCLNELEVIAVEKVNEAAKNGSLLKVLHLPFILYSWQNWRKEKVVEWIQHIIIDDKVLITFLEKFVAKSYTNIGVKHFLDTDSIKEFIDPALLIDRVRKISEQEDLTENQKSAIDLFIRGYESKLQGKSPTRFTE